MVILPSSSLSDTLLAAVCLQHYARLLEQQLPLMASDSVPHTWRLVGEDPPEHPLTHVSPEAAAAGVLRLAVGLLEAQEPQSPPTAVNEAGAPAVAAVDGLPRPPSEQADPKVPPPPAVGPDGGPLVTP